MYQDDYVIHSSSDYNIYVNTVDQSKTFCAPYIIACVSAAKAARHIQQMTFLRFAAHKHKTYSKTKLANLSRKRSSRSQRVREFNFQSYAPIRQK